MSPSNDMDLDLDQNGSALGFGPAAVHQWFLVLDQARLWSVDVRWRFTLDRSPSPLAWDIQCGRVGGGRGWGRAWLRTRPSYTRLPGQETTVSATRLRCSFNMGTSAEWLMPAVDRPLTATIMSPHLEDQARRTSAWTEPEIQRTRTRLGHSLEAAVVVGGRAEDDGLDEEGLVAVALLVPAHDAEAPAARVAPSQDDLVAAVQVAGGQSGPEVTTRTTT